MTEKRVSVRLAAVGGRQVRAELEGVGTAGARGFGRLSREMELANARLAAFARRARLAMAAAAASVAAAGVAMVRSGLQTVDAQAKLAQSLGTTVASIQVLARAGELAGVAMSGIEQATKDLTRRLSQAAAGGGPAVAALDRLGLSAGALLALPLDARVDAINAAIAAFVPAAERAAVAGQLFGEEGSIAMARLDSATLRQATEDLRAFGVVVSEADADQIERSNDALSRLGLIWRGLSNQLAVAAAPALEAAADALAAVAQTTGPLGLALRGVIENLGRLGAYAGSLAAFLAGRWVAGLAVAALSVRGLATALVVLRGALIRTGIGVLVVGAGELAYQVGRLAQGVGGLGAAFGMLAAAGREAWDRLGLGIAATWARVEAGWAGTQGSLLSGLQGVVVAVTDWGNAVAGVFRGAFDAMVATWSRLPGVIGDLVYGAANGVIGGVEAMLNGVVDRINRFIATINDTLALLPDWAQGDWSRIEPLTPFALGGIKNPYAGAAADAGTAAAEAFRKAMGERLVTAPDLFGGAAAEAQGRADAHAEAAGMLAGAADRPRTAWEALKGAVVGAGTEGAAALDAAGTAAGDMAEALTAAKGAAKGAGGAAKDAAEEAKLGWAAVSEALATYATEALDWGKGLGSTLVSAFQSAESAFRSFVTTGKLDFKGLVGSILADLAVLAFRKNVLGPIAQALSGALGGGGGGGGGGFLASLFHTGGLVGGPAATRAVPALAFAGAPRLHAGGWAGLKPDEVPAILQRGERVLSRREAAGYGRDGNGALTGGVSIQIDARGAQAGVAEQIEARLRAALPEILRLAKQGVAEGRRRGQAL